MKKYFFSLAAVLIAIGMSAFTAPKAPKPEKVNFNLHWYYCSTDGTELQYYLGWKTRQWVMAIGDCTNESIEYICAKGYEDPQMMQYPAQMGHDKLMWAE